MRPITQGSKRFCGSFLGLFSPSTVTALGGITLLSYGLWSVYEPLAYIVPGLGLTAFGLWLAGMFSKTG